MSTTTTRLRRVSNAIGNGTDGTAAAAMAAQSAYAREHFRRMSLVSTLAPDPEVSMARFDAVLSVLARNRPHQDVEGLAVVAIAIVAEDTGYDHLETDLDMATGEEAREPSRIAAALSALAALTLVEDVIEHDLDPGSEERITRDHLAVVAIATRRLTTMPVDDEPMRNSDLNAETAVLDAFSIQSISAPADMAIHLRELALDDCIDVPALKNPGVRQPLATLADHAARIADTVGLSGDGTRTVVAAAIDAVLAGDYCGLPAILDLPVLKALLSQDAIDTALGHVMCQHLASVVLHLLHVGDDMEPAASVDEKTIRRLVAPALLDMVGELAGMPPEHRGSTEVREHMLREAASMVTGAAAFVESGELDRATEATVDHMRETLAMLPAEVLDEHLLGGSPRPMPRMDARLSLGIAIVVHGAMSDAARGRLDAAISTLSATVTSTTTASGTMYASDVVEVPVRDALALAKSLSAPTGVRYAALLIANDGDGAPAMALIHDGRKGQMVAIRGNDEGGTTFH